MIRELVEYRANLSFPPISTVKRKALRGIAEKYYFNPAVKTESFDFQYNGRDVERHVLVFLLEVAAVFVAADGLIRCQTVWENDDETSEVFQVKHSKIISVPQTEKATA